MRTDKELQKMLVDKMQHYRDSVAVFRIRTQNATELHNESIRLALPFTNVDQAKELRCDGSRKEHYTHLQLQESATLQYYHASGYKLFQKNTNPYANMVSADAEKTDVAEFESRACDILEKSKLNISGSFEDVKFEKLWRLKSRGIAKNGNPTATVINRLVYAFRRFVNEIPVWGSASVFIKTAAENRLDAFGMDWRQIHDSPITKASVISPEDAARMALEQLQNTNPEKVYTPKDFTVDFFALGYFSHAKTMYQTVLQPVYVAKFISNGFSKMGHVITVPAAGTPYESICRKMTPPPFNSQRIEKSVVAIHPKAPGSAPGELLTCTTNRG